MITQQAYETSHPCLRDDIVIGPPLRMGAATVYHLKDTCTSWFYRIGVKEHFVLSKLDGSRSLQEIDQEYVATFGRRPPWAMIFQLLEKRQLLTSSSDSAALAELKNAAEAKKREGRNKGLFRKRFVLIKGDRFLEKLLPRVGFAFHPAFVFPALLAILLLEVFVLSHIPTIIGDLLASYHNPLNIVLFLCIAWLAAALHEIAHGLTCKRFGGSVSEMGIVWRYLSFFPYCKLDDVLLFHRRSHRIYTVVAGVFVNLLCIIPFGILWSISPPQSMVRSVSTLMLISFNITTFSNFIPFVELDGYFVLCHWLNMVELRREAHRFWKAGMQRILFKKQERVVEYTRRDRSIYTVYGLFSLLFTMSFLIGMLFFWFTRLKAWFGAIAAWSFFGVIGLLVLYRYREAVKSRLARIVHRDARAGRPAEI